MKENTIVLEPFELISVIKISGIQQVNCHGKIDLTGLIQAEKRSEYLKKATNETWIKISIIDEEGETIPFFNGILEHLKIEISGGLCVLSLTAFTGTALMDFRYHLRSFQRSGLTYKEVINTCNEGYFQSATIMTEGQGIELSHIYMQYRESDWEFLKRLASSLHTIIVPSCKTKGVKYFFGIPAKKQTVLFEPNFCMIKQGWEDDKLKRENGIFIGNEDLLCYEVRSREIYELGSNVDFDGRSLCIWRIETHLKGNELIHTYYLKSKEGFQVPEVYNEKLVGLALLGDVKNVEGEKIQMSIDGDENETESGNCWFQYSTVYSSEDGTGWYCMPEIGDKVRLCFPTEDEEKAYAASAVHKNRRSGIRTDPSQKIWRNKEAKEIRLMPKKILLTNNNGLSIELDDDKGISVRSNKSINITASEDIGISSTNAGLKMNASKRIVLQQGDSKMIMDDGIRMEGAKVKLE